jgi:hypothetical protein
VRDHARQRPARPSPALGVGLHGFSEPATGLAAAREMIAATFARSPDLRFDKSRVYIGGGHFASEYQMSGTAEVSLSRVRALT